MIGTSLWDYLFIRSCIFVLHLIAPLSIVHFLARWFVKIPFYIPRILEAWLTLEAAFYLLVYLPLRAHLQKPSSTAPPTLSREDRRVLFRRCHDNIPDPEEYLSKWFLGAAEDDIRRENVKDFFRWAFLDTRDPDPAHSDELEEQVGEMEKLLGRELLPGRSSTKCLRLTFDKVEMLHRSLAWYCVSYIQGGGGNLP